MEARFNLERGFLDPKNHPKIMKSEKKSFGKITKFSKSKVLRYFKITFTRDVLGEKWVNAKRGGKGIFGRF